MITRQVKVRHKHEITEIAEIVVYIQILNQATSEITPILMQIRTYNELWGVFPLNHLL